MDDEKHNLSNWSRKNVFPKSKENDLSKMVLDAIYNLRRVLIEQKINAIKLSEVEDELQRTESLESVMLYTGLKIRLANRLGRVV